MYQNLIKTNLLDLIFYIIEAVEVIFDELNRRFFWVITQDRILIKIYVSEKIINFLYSGGLTLQTLPKMEACSIYK